MNLIHEVEDRYGSIKKTPMTDKTWQEIQSICCSHGDKSEKIPIELQTKIARKIDEGRPINYVVTHYHVPPDTVSKVITNYGITQKPMFFYVLSKKGEPSYFFRSKQKALPLIFRRTFRTAKIANSFLRNNHYSLRTRNVIWKNIPIGSYYMADHSDFILKSNNDYVEANDD